MRIYKSIIIFGLSIILGVLTAFSVNAVFNGTVEEVENHSTTSVVPITSLEEYMWFVDAVVVGTVLKELPTYQQDAGIPTKVPVIFPVTPATIKVDDVVYGDITDTEFTLLQHGTNEDATLVQKGEEYLFLLQKSPDGGYWPLNIEEGKLKIENGQVSSKVLSTFPELVMGKNSELEELKTKFLNAALKKKKPYAIQ